jgi:hypothetical protein
MDKAIKKYLANIGRKGGQKSRRELSPEAARSMVKIREARRAFKRFYTRCFWSYRPDYIVKAEDIPWVCKQLMTHGGREGWKIGERLCR